MLVSSLLCLDFLMLCLTCYFVGFAVTALITASLSIFGVLLCNISYRRLLRANERLERNCIGGLPRDRELLQIYEARGTLMLSLLFLYPGLLSDLCALFIVLPKFGERYYEKLLSVLLTKAQRNGKTLEQLIANKCTTNLAKSEKQVGATN